MNRETNKKLVINFYRAIKTQDWDLLESLLHDELTTSRKLFEGNKFSPFQFPVNPFMVFQNLLKVDKNLIDEMSKGYTDKKGFIAWAKILRDFVSNYEINDICVDENRVWVSTFSSFAGPHSKTLYLNFFTRFWIEDSKILAVLFQGRFLNTLAQYGNVMVKHDDIEGINNYLQALQEMGLIPDNRVG